MTQLFFFITPLLSLVILQPQVPWKKGLGLFILGVVLGTLFSGKVFDSYLPLWSLQSVFLYSLKQIDIIFAAVCILLFRRKQTLVLLAAFFSSRAFFTSLHPTLLSQGEVITLVLQRTLILTFFSFPFKKEPRKILEILFSFSILLGVALTQTVSMYLNNMIIVVAFLFALQLLLFVYFISKGMFIWSKDTS